MNFVGSALNFHTRFAGVARTRREYGYPARLALGRHGANTGTRTPCSRPARRGVRHARDVDLWTVPAMLVSSRPHREYRHEGALGSDTSAIARGHALAAGRVAVRVPQGQLLPRSGARPHRRRAGGHQLPPVLHRPLLSSGSLDHHQGLPARHGVHAAARLSAGLRDRPHAVTLGDGAARGRGGDDLRHHRHQGVRTHHHLQRRGSVEPIPAGPGRRGHALLHHGHPYRRRRGAHALHARIRGAAALQRDSYHPAVAGGCRSDPRFEPAAGVSARRLSAEPARG